MHSSYKQSKERKEKTYIHTYTYNQTHIHIHTYTKKLNNQIHNYSISTYVRLNRWQIRVDYN